MKRKEKYTQVKSSDMTCKTSSSESLVSQQSVKERVQNLPSAIDINIDNLLHVTASACGDFSFDYCAYPT